MDKRKSLRLRADLEFGSDGRLIFLTLRASSEEAKNILNALMYGQRKGLAYCQSTTIKPVGWGDNTVVCRIGE